MSISEPATMATDYLLAVLCGYWAWRLGGLGKSTAQASVCYWSAGFLCLGVASLAGGAFHGFSTMCTQAVLVQLWKVTVYAIGLASFFLLGGTLTASCVPSVRRAVILVPYLQLLVYVFWMAAHDDFYFAVYNYTVKTLSVLALQLHAGLARGARSAPWLVGGVLVSFFAAAVQLSEFSVHRHFNHNDLYHVIQTGGLYLFYRGARLLQDR